MNENEINNFPSENGPVPMEDRDEQMSDNYTESEPPSSGYIDDDEPQEGFSFNLSSLFIGLAMCFVMFQGTNIFTDWQYILSLSAVIIIHEMGHVTFGKMFGCVIKEMQVFFIPFISYKPRQYNEGSSWRSIKWSLGALPLGGLTVFKSREADEVEYDNYGPSPYIEDKEAWKRLLISAAGVLFNITTFLILYFTLPYMSTECYHIFGPIAVYSLILAILNILPIYPLDGGAIVFALYEIITGNRPSPMFTKICGWIGFVVIILFFWVFPQWMDGFLDKVFGLFF